MSADIIVTGVPELDRALKQLEDKAQKRVAKSAVSKGLTFLRKRIAKTAPVGPTGNLKASIGKRFKKDRRSGVTTGKVGIDVGKAKQGEKKKGSHGHLVALGTKQRQTASGANRGTMPANDFVKRTTESNSAAVQAVMLKGVRVALDRELKKLGFKR